MIPLTYKENKSYEKQKVCYICQKGFSTDNINGVAFSGAALNRKYHKVRNHCHYTGKFRGAAHSICNLRYKKHQNKSIGKLAKAFNGQLECLGENTDKYITFSVPIS